ncbi:MAG: Xaa-Pro dipeptidase [Patescibacteria group bacterium]|nr:Xaa-Pro dipeptidase [Patescibacteria group bacterium]
MAVIRRINSLRELLAESKVEALIVSNPANVRYLSDFSGSDALLVISGNSQALFTDSRYEATASEEVGPSIEVRISSSLLKNVAQWLRSKGFRKVGYEADSLTITTYKDLESILEENELVATSGLVERLRLYKDQTEVSSIQKAAEIVDQCFAHICGFIHPDVSEAEIAAELEYQMKTRGATQTSFGTIVASGKNSARPHAVPGQKKVRSGDLITIDMGAVVEGYCSDFTRTICIGQPTEEQEKIYGIVHSAQQKALAAIRPGIRGCDLDAIARTIISDAGYGAQFGHSLGHGVGLCIHEAPRISRTSTDILQPGMVITIEPGIYKEGWGGVRIEDLVLVTKEGHQNLTKSPNPNSLLCLN